MAFGCFALLTAVSVAYRAIIIARWRQGDRRLIDPVRRFNRRWTNPTAIAYLRAGQRGSPYALVQHRGRRSGRLYTTPVIAVRVSGGLVIPLAYGASVDWYQNLVAAGGGKLQWRGQVYTVGAPQVQAAAVAVGAFPLIWQLPLRLYGIAQFIRVPLEVATHQETANAGDTEAHAAVR
jgi:deazaflavin-dependent oxidoreductase (nitroreductase family)